MFHLRMLFFGMGRITLVECSINIFNLSYENINFLNFFFFDSRGCDVGLARRGSLNCRDLLNPVHQTAEPNRPMVPGAGVARRRRPSSIGCLLEKHGAAFRLKGCLNSNCRYAGPHQTYIQIIT